MSVIRVNEKKTSWTEFPFANRYSITKKSIHIRSGWLLMMENWSLSRISSEKGCETQTVAKPRLKIREVLLYV